jgi:hypothetical protein
MPSLLSFFERLFAAEPLVDEDAYADEAQGRPNPFHVQFATEHHHVITIMDFLRQDLHLSPWLQQEVREQVIHDPRFSLNDFVITYQ